ncbi:GSCFA domain-containing protein [Dawidia soli]|uniref:GSCFA domain-containing protein n=1 Tax=Dawidia soli TaxID=2782352 RepID=A0AAP2D762_9BACT|nr:GSCFA domain-containing protein [Dawidia soli]MBT1686372.1 GSCFA domain-containing protein [Dawidia soli]
MNTFRTTLNAGVSTHTLALTSRILTLGSCFADSIGSRLAALKLATLANPFGTLYNPLSMHKALGYAALDAPIPPHTYLRHDDVHLNYDFHSELSALTHEALTHRLQQQVATVHTFLQHTDYLLLTYGTAWAYTRRDTGEVVANCHKQPAVRFDKTLLTADAIVASFGEVLTALRARYPALRVILTVSPVRHIKDTLVLNSVSKSVLRVACHTLQERFDYVEYFPAFEILLDDLRDYRFYKADMLHPTEEAEAYIWQQFKARYFDASLQSFADTWAGIQQALAHRPFHPASQAHQKFVRDTLRRLEELKPVVDVEQEIHTLKLQLTS